MKLLKIRTTRQESSNSVISLESSSNHSARTTGSRSSSSSARKSAGSILILGLDGAGKTTILYRFALNQSVDTLPTLTSNKETVALESETLGGENTWDLVDVGGSPALRHTWSTYARAVDGIIYVVDSTAEDRLSEAGHCLRRLYHREPLTLDDLASSSVESDNTDFNRALSATKSLTHAPSSTPCATLDVPLLLIVNKKRLPRRRQARQGPQGAGPPRDGHQAGDADPVRGPHRRRRRGGAQVADGRGALQPQRGQAEGERRGETDRPAEVEGKVGARQGGLRGRRAVAKLTGLGSRLAGVAP
mmetsp:Transcript_2372/g.6327  ORF Transcript_2372/g.6327 Transcript_2372/m.6327 type:complete len:304 (+) Transcript_2372:245-1156(+)